MTNESDMIRANNASGDADANNDKEEDSDEDEDEDAVAEAGAIDAANDFSASFLLSAAIKI